MFGQGGPHGRPQLDEPRRSTIRRWRCLLAAGWMVCAQVAWVSAAGSAVHAADALDVRIRIAWGGGEARAWQGAIRVSDGTLSEVAPLGLEVDAPGSMLPLDPAAIRIVGRSPRSYDGCDLRVQAPADAKLLVQLWDDQAAAAAPLEIPLARVLQEFLQYDLDDRRNRLFVQRSPGDAIRVRFERPSLVFSPSEKFDIEVQPQHLPLAANTSYVLSASLGPARTDESTWNEDLELRTAADGSAPAASLSVPLPVQEGAYDLRLALYPATLLPKRLAAPLVRKAIATRKVQLVVVAPVKTLAAQSAPWQSVLEFDPASPRWWERMARLPSWARLPVVPRHIESGRVAIRSHLGKSWVELAPGAWQAYPLSIAAPGTPHVLEIEFPSDIAQTLSISLVEPNAAGYVGPVGLDSGIDVSPPAAGHKPAVHRHRLVCWPQSKTPYVLLVNRRDNASAVFGKVEVQAGPASLPPLAVPPVVFPARMLAGYFEKPLFTENFSASDAVDPISRKGLDDWQTFAAGGERLLEALQHAGFNALVLTAACDGSALYPSALISPTPRYDSGVFFESGQDPVRKDVLELLFRLCDRRGVVLIPAVQFTSPLPQLEALRLAGEAEAAGLEPLGADGLTWLERSGSSGGAGAYYNALDERVQRAMTAVVAELAERYGHHASFGGVAVHLNSDGYAVVPDRSCSLDDVTFARFLREAGVELPPSGDPPLAARWSFIAGPAAQKWLDWRADRLAGLYRQMSRAVTQRRSGAKLYLTTANLLTGRQWQAALRPELPPKNSLAEVLPQVGLALDRLSDDDIIVPRPQRIIASASPQARDQEQHWNRHAALDALWSKAAHRATHHLLVPASLRLPEFEAASPFGPDKTRLLLISQIVPADAAQRERFVTSLARHDASMMIDGGWLLPLGQEAALAPLAKVYRRLPAEPFETVAHPTQPQELLVRTLAKGDKTYFYVVNPAPWPVTAQLQFSCPESLRITSYSDQRTASVQAAAGGGTWSIDMEPFDLVGGEIASGRAKVTKWSVLPPASAAAELSESLADMRRRANDLGLHPRPVTLENASFEAPLAGGFIPGWVYARGGGLTVEIDTAPGTAGRSLHLASHEAAGALWVRSNPLPALPTGRILMTARLRTSDAAAQPQLRLAIEGKLDGQVYYKRVNIGAKEREGDPTPPLLATEWKTYEIALPNLPVSGLSELRVGFDLMSDGEVWIDDVQVFDLWLQNSEVDELLKSAAAARWQMEQGRLNESRLFLEDYWPSFLRRHVQVSEARQLAPAPPPRRDAAAPAIGSAAPPSPPAAPQPPAPQTSDKRKGWLPGWLKWR